MDRMPKVGESQRCATCHYYRETGTTWRRLSADGGEVKGAGECRRESPRGVIRDSLTRGDRVYAMWPELSADDWCGEWPPREGVE